MCFCFEINNKAECELRLNGVKANVSEDYFVKWDLNCLFSMRWVKFKTQDTPLFDLRPLGTVGCAISVFPTY